MGFAKKLIMDMQEKGDWPRDELNEKYVCANHFSNSYLKEKITKTASHGICSYCGKATMVRDMHSFCLDLIWKIRLYFCDINDAGLYLADDYDDNEVIPGFKRVGEYVVPEENTVYGSIQELLEDLDLETDKEELNVDIQSCFTTEQWISKDIYEEDKTIRLKTLWDKFCNDVTKKRRFTFLASPEYNPFVEDAKSNNILDSLKKIINEQNLCKTLDEGTILFRARKISDKKRQYTFDDITSAPDESAIPNRMSPAGISMFYGSFDADTPIKECSGGEELEMIIGTFKTAKPITVIDLTTISPNSFWMNGWQENKFLHQFNVEITKPIKEKDKNHLQYIPTQVITEYFRYMFVDTNGNNIDGIIYGSSKTRNKNIVLFCNQRESHKMLCDDVEIIVYERKAVWEEKK